MCAALRVPVDIDRLLTTEDPTYVAWVTAVLERAAAIQREAHEHATAK